MIDGMIVSMHHQAELACQECAGTLQADRIRSLESLREWCWDEYAAAWDQHFEALQAWQASHDDAYPVRGAEDEEENELAVWIHNQRLDHANQRVRLTQERQERLEHLPGWVWDAHAAACVYKYIGKHP